MPSDVRKQLASKLDTLDFKETAKECDNYFDKAGKLKEQPTASSINNVGVLKHPQQQQQQQQQKQPTTTFSTPFSDEEESDVNAVRFRQGQRQSFNVSNRSSSRGRSSSNFGSRGGNSNNNNFNPRSNSSNGRFGGASNSSSGNSYNASGGNSYNASSSSNPPNKHVCRFHVKFGEDAENCEGSWCLLKHKVAPKGQASR